jgi:hypothetical protein
LKRQKRVTGSFLKIYTDKETMAKQGQYPVIFITFKDVKDGSYDKTVEKIKDLIIEEYTKYIRLLKVDFLEKPEKDYFERIINFEELKNWYNGYIFGDRVIYNPWSVLNYVYNFRDGFKAYWTNTSSNDLVKMLVTKGGAELKKELEELEKGKSIEKRINEDIVMGEIDKDTENVWSFLLFSGYLKVVKKRLDMGEMYCNLSIPNK